MRKDRRRNAGVLGGLQDAASHPHHPVFFGKYAGAGIQVSPSRQHPKVLVGLHLQDSAPTKSKVGMGQAKMGGATVQRVRARLHEAQIQIVRPWLVLSPQGAGGPAAHSGVILLARPVNVLEESHGEGHAQNL